MGTCIYLAASCYIVYSIIISFKRAFNCIYLYTNVYVADQSIDQISDRKSIASYKKDFFYPIGLKQFVSTLIV